MEAKELRIGNYVSYATQETLILDINRTHAELGYYMDSIGFERKYHEFRPIPLTEEWLLKFGFVFDSYGEYCKGAYSLDNEYTDKGVYNFVIHKETCLDIEIKYLHQLQNLYFALTNEELTIQ